MKTITVHVQYAVAQDGVPAAHLLRQWVKMALQQARPPPMSGTGRRSAGQRLAAEITVRVVGEREITDLNYRYRHHDGPTNVLSFSYDIPSGADLPLFGDIVLCAPVTAQEASAQGKELLAHWAHLVIHGSLHLLGFDHEDETTAALMEAREMQILAQLGYPDPYHEADVIPLPLRKIVNVHEGRSNC